MLLFTLNINGGLMLIAVLSKLLDSSGHILYQQCDIYGHALGVATSVADKASHGTLFNNYTVQSCTIKFHACHSETELAYKEIRDWQWIGCIWQDSLLELRPWVPGIEMTSAWYTKLLPTTSQQALLHLRLRVLSASYVCSQLASLLLHLLVC